MPRCMYFWTETILLNIHETGTNLHSYDIGIDCLKELLNLQEIVCVSEHSCVYTAKHFRLDDLSRSLIRKILISSFSFRLQVIFLSNFYEYVRKLQIPYNVFEYISSSFEVKRKEYLVKLFEHLTMLHIYYDTGKSCFPAASQLCWHGEPPALTLLLVCCNTGSQFLIALADHEFSFDWFLVCIY